MYNLKFCASLSGTSKVSPLFSTCVRNQSVSGFRHHSEPAPNRLRAQGRIAEIDSTKPFSQHLVDKFSRRHDYLRISLTERCNLRCVYCMPSEGVDLSPKPHLLTDDEIVRVATLFVRNGVTKIRLTGGEPTVRKGILEIIARLNDLRQHGLRSIGMTSNGIALSRRLPQYIDSGLTHLNLSLDTLDPFKFEIMTRRPGHDAVLRTLDNALSAPGLRSVKLNVVVVKGLNDGEILDFVELARDRRLSVRFIEFMPFTGNKWDKAKMIPSSDLLSRITQRYPGVTKVSDEDNDTARSWKIPSFKGNFGFISSMSDHFCGTCNRLRVTADGNIKVCLFDVKEISLRDAMRSGISDSDLIQIIGAAVGEKQEKHPAMEDIDKENNRPMIFIGTSMTRESPFARRTVKSRSHFQNHLGPHEAHFLPQLHHSRASQTSPYLRRSIRHYSNTGDRAPAVGSPETSDTPQLTHIDAEGRASMVDVGLKPPTNRSATARGRIWITELAYEMVATTSTSDMGHYPRRRRSGEMPTGHEEQDVIKRIAEFVPDGTAQERSQEARARQEKARAKGDALTIAQLAAIMGCKRTSDLIPLCHPLSLSHISVRLWPEAEDANSLEIDRSPAFSMKKLHHSIVCEATVTCEGKTGVEMEALTAVSVGLLTVWDMLKAVAGQQMIIDSIFVSKKSGGKSGDFTRDDAPRGGITRV